MRKPFTDQVALVTGAASGIGRATALAFANMGARVIVSDINPEGGKETLSLIEALDGEAVFCQTDVSQLDEVKKLMEFCVSSYGRLDYGINNAGIGGAWGKIAEYPIEEYHQVMKVNLDGVFYCMQLEIQQMLKQEGGAIVNVASIAGLKGLANSGPYSASKHAVIGLTKSAALEYARKGIRINAVCPVYTRTPLFEKIFEVDASYEQKLLSLIPMKRYGTPEDIASAIIWLCSSQSDFVTGQAIALDGGLTAG